MRVRLSLPAPAIAETAVSIYNIEYVSMATIPKKYLHDRLILVLASVTALLALACAIIVLLRFGTEGGSGYIVQYRANLGISAFKTGDVANILSFVLFAPVVSVFNIVLSIRLYHIRRQLSLVVLGLGIIVLVLAIIVSNALLVLR